jgi:hypothetical protein
VIFCVKGKNWKYLLVWEECCTFAKKNYTSLGRRKRKIADETPANRVDREVL